MTLNEILQDKKLNKMMNSYIAENYGKYKASYYIEFNDYKQEIYVYLMEHLKEFDNNKSNISTFLYMCISTKTLNIVRSCKAKKRNKENIVSLNNVCFDNEGDVTEYIEMLKDDINIEDDYINSELLQFLMKYYENNEYMKQLVILLSQGFTKRQIEREFGYCHTTVYKKIGKSNKKGTLAYIVNQYLKKV